MAAEDLFVRAVRRALEQRADAGEPLSQAAIAEKIGAAVGETVYQQEVSRFLAGGGGLRQDKLAALLRLLRLTVVPEGRVKKARRTA